MASPFRYNKKQRKAYRRRAKAGVKTAEKLSADGNTELEALSRRLAELNVKIGLAKRKKHKRNNPK